MGPFLDFMSEHVYHFMEGNVYLGVSLMLDMGGLLVLAGLGMAAYRRYVVRPAKLNNVLDDAVALTLLAVIIVTGFAVEGAESPPRSSMPTPAGRCGRLSASSSPRRSAVWGRTQPWLCTRACGGATCSYPWAPWPTSSSASRSWPTSSPRRSTCSSSRRTAKAFSSPSRSRRPSRPLERRRSRT